MTVLARCAVSADRTRPARLPARWRRYTYRRELGHTLYALQQCKQNDEQHKL